MRLAGLQGVHHRAAEQFMKDVVVDSHGCPVDYQCHHYRDPSRRIQSPRRSSTRPIVKTVVHGQLQGLGVASLEAGHMEYWLT